MLIRNFKNQSANKKNRLISFLKNFDIDKLYLTIKYGIPIREGNVDQLRKNNFQDLKGPVFFLSTGRCGTEWFAKYLQNSLEDFVQHEPWPNFAEASQLAYIEYEETNADSSKFLNEIFLSGREQQLRYTYKTGKRYIETNHYLTFFAPYLAELFPNAIFVHLHRHPLQFIKSGMRRGWYSKHQHHLKPHKNNPYFETWSEQTQEVKLAWLWAETNRFIENFKTEINKNRVFTFNFNDLNIDNITSLNTFLNIVIREKDTYKKMTKKENIQKTGKAKSFKEFDTESQKIILDLCNSLSRKYGYDIR